MSFKRYWRHNSKILEEIFETTIHDIHRKYKPTYTPSSGLLAIFSEFNPRTVTINPGINSTAPANTIIKNRRHENVWSPCCIRLAPGFRLRSTLAYTAGLILGYSRQICGVLLLEVVKQMPGQTRHDYTCK